MVFGQLFIDVFSVGLIDVSSETRHNYFVGAFAVHFYLVVLTDYYSHSFFLYVFLVKNKSNHIGVLILDMFVNPYFKFQQSNKDILLIDKII